MDVSINGFSPENMERIYLGQPALTIDGKFPAEALTERQHEVAKLMAANLNRVDIAATIYFSAGTVKQEMVAVNERLGLASGHRIPLAGYFPLEPDAPILNDKALWRLSPQSLVLIEGMSTGKSDKVLAQQFRYSNNQSVKSLVNWVKPRWPVCVSRLDMVRTANGLRANYARSFPRTEDGGFSETTLGRLALPELVIYESGIRTSHGFKPVH